MSERLLASGRSADIYEAGEGRVLRRRRNGPIPDHEVAAMRHAAAHGYPVPSVHTVDGNEMLMDRVDGPDLIAQLASRPWRATAVGRVLADLHQRLAELPIDGLVIRTGAEPAESLVHGDLHPGNVLMTAGGPVVIDWEGASLGPNDADAATLWLLLSIASVDDVPAPLRPFVPLVRRGVLWSYFRTMSRPRSSTVAAICDGRLGDPNMRPAELERIRRFRQRHARPTAS